MTQIRISIPAPTTTRALAAVRERESKQAAFLPQAIASRQFAVNITAVLTTHCHCYITTNKNTTATHSDRVAFRCVPSLSANLLYTPAKLRLINCDPSHQIATFATTASANARQRPNRQPISYRRARRLALLQTLSEDANYSPPPSPTTACDPLSAAFAPTPLLILLQARPPARMSCT